MSFRDNLGDIRESIEQISGVTEAGLEAYVA